MTPIPFEADPELVRAHPTRKDPMNEPTKARLIVKEISMPVLYETFGGEVAATDTTAVRVRAASRNDECEIEWTTERHKAPPVGSLIRVTIEKD